MLITQLPLTLLVQIMKSEHFKNLNDTMLFINTLTLLIWGKKIKC